MEEDGEAGLETAVVEEDGKAAPLGVSFVAGFVGSGSTAFLMVNAGPLVDSLDAAVAGLSSAAGVVVSDEGVFGFAFVPASAVEVLFFGVLLEDSLESDFLAVADCLVEELFPEDEEELFVEDAEEVLFVEAPLFELEDPDAVFLTADLEVLPSDFFSTGALHKAVAVTQTRTGMEVRRNERTDISA